MAKKKKNGIGGIIYSTDPGYPYEEDQVSVPALPPSQQRLRIWLDSKHRAGKSVTLITGFEGKAVELEAMGKALKTYCGAGGAVKDGEIILQGDHREKVMQWLLAKGYTNTKRSGG